MNLIQTILSIGFLFSGISYGELLQSSTEETEPALPGIEIFNFEDNEPRWFTVDDDVMGGVSSSQFEIIDPGYMSFYGSMSLDNNGGFSSVRSEWNPTDLSTYDGVILRVYGDGNDYRLRIRSTETGRDITYNALFETRADQWGIVYIPFDIMVPTYRGFIMNVDPLDTSSIGSFGIMLSDKQEGEFQLLVDWMRAVREEDLGNANW